jgi:hypothetical protein
LLLHPQRYSAPWLLFRLHDRGSLKTALLEPFVRAHGANHIRFDGLRFNVFWGDFGL